MKIRVFDDPKDPSDSMFLEVLYDRQVQSDRRPYVSEICAREAFRAEALFSIAAVDDHGRRRHVVASKGSIRIPTNQAFWIEIHSNGELEILEPHQVDDRFFMPNRRPLHAEL